MLNELIRHEKDLTALSKEESTYSTKANRVRHKPTTKGWRILVDWHDGTSSWAKLSDIKQSYSVQLAEYAKAKGLENESPFIWWVGSVPRRRDRILKGIKSNKYWMRTHKYGVELPHSIKEALAINRKTGTIYWQQTIDAKEVIPSDAPEPLGIPVIMSAFADADHAGCKAAQRSHTGVIIFLNNSPIL